MKSALSFSPRLLTIAIVATLAIAGPAAAQRAQGEPAKTKIQAEAAAQVATDQAEAARASAQIARDATHVTGGTYSTIHQHFLEQLAESIGIVLNTIEANMRTEQLLAQSQSLAEELRSQQEELKQTNEELEYKARLLEEQKAEVESKNREVETVCGRLCFFVCERAI